MLRLVTLVAVLFLTLSVGAQDRHGSSNTGVNEESKPTQPTLDETLQWLTGATDEESGDGSQHHELEISDADKCNVTITETRVKAGPDFWIKESFSLKDIDPDDIQVEKLGDGRFKQLFDGQSSVRFHTRNYTQKIMHTSNSHAEGIATSDYIFFTNDRFAPRFAKALKRAARLCGARPSSF